MNRGIVGHEEQKFSDLTEAVAKRLIRTLVEDEAVTTVVSGGCPLGGVDIWAENTADLLSKGKIIHKPKDRRWETGYKPRNLLIARDSDEVHVVVVRAYPPEYDSMRFPICYHCNTADHIKSGGCWTAREAMKLGKRGVWHTIAPDGTITTTENPCR